MDEKKVRTKNEKAPEKDFYSVVIVCQFFLCLLLVGIVFLLNLYGGAFGKDVTDRISEILSHNSTAEEMSSAVNVMKDFFSGDALAVFGGSVTDVATDGNVKPEAEETAIPMGGDDLELFEATEKTSFAPYITTDKLLSPIENGRYTSYFGYRTNPITGEWSFHTGLDIAAKEGTKIRSALSGTVTTVGEDSRAGKYIIVTHSEGFQTFYCHCSEILGEEGMNINKGETIALVGTTGWSTGPHLHFEVRRDGIRLNPLWALENDC